MEYQPPPFFKQGPSALTRLIFYALLALGLLVADARYNALALIRTAVATALYPVQRFALFPTQLLGMGGQYFVALDRVEHENEILRRERLVMAQTALSAEQLRSENAQLRRLLDAREQQSLKSVAAEILYDTRDAFSRKVIVDRGSSSEVTAGQPVIDDSGVIGQVTRVFPFNSEVTLLTDKDHAIPVQMVRSGLRAVVFGGSEDGQLELRFMASNADVQKDDVLVTSGLDGVYPAGLPVAKVVRIDRAASSAFAKIICVPLGGIDRNRHVLILLTEKIEPPPLAEVPVSKGAKGPHGMPPMKADQEPPSSVPDQSPVTNTAPAAKAAP